MKTKRDDEQESKREWIYNRATAPAGSANSFHQTSQIHHAISGAEHPQGQRPSSALRAPSHYRSRPLGASQASAAPFRDSGCAFRAWTPVAADPHQPHPSLRSPHPSMPPLELSGRRHFPPVPLLRLDVGGVHTAEPGFRAGMSFGLDCRFTREDLRPSFERTADVCLSG